MAPADRYDEDDLYDENDDEVDEEEELSDEDKVAMQRGTELVKKSLGANANKVTVKQIQDALWHYYYDVDKSVAYLSKTFIVPPPQITPKKALERSGTFLQVAFRDMPWLNTPRDRHGRFEAPRPLPGGLLGGADGPPKMSKLQALAAARRKKMDEKGDHGRNLQAESGIKRLSITDELRREDSAAPPTSAKRQRGSGASSPKAPSIHDLKSSHGESQSPTILRKTSGNEMNGVSPATLPRIIAQTLDGEVDHDVAAAQALNSTPSAFAKAIFNPTPDSRQANRPEFFALPYASSSSFVPEPFSGPSPDDVVLAAQAKAGKKNVAATKPASSTPKKSLKSNAASSGSDVVNGMSNLKVSDVPPPKNKGLNVVQEYKASDSKKSISFVVVGHVDAGKSTLMGRLLLELKQVQERTVDKYRRQAEKSGKQSFALAWVMDQRTEERERGVTIDVATNHFETPTTKFTILDAPGHRDFVPNMIAGASQADFAILVIDANTGAYEKGLKGQTREHVLLLRSLGVQRLIVAVNKLDMIGWSQGRFDEISQQVSGFLTGLGFQSKLVSFIPISGLNGDNIAGKTEDAAADWYNGPTLIEALEETEASSARQLTKPFRMSVSEVFRSQQQGATTLAGRVDSGNIQIGDAVMVQPSGESTFVKSIVMDSESREWAVAGQSISIALTDIDPIHIRIGDILCGTTDPISVGDTFTIKAMAFEHLMPMPIDLHRGRLHAAGQIQAIPATLNKASGAVIRKRPKVVQPGEVARAIIKLNTKVPLEQGQRVVLRSGGETIAAGLLD